MTIEVLGTGCAKCDKLEEMTRTVAQKLGLSCEIKHIQDIDAIIQRGVLAPPALVIDGRVVVSGRMPTEAELTTWLTSAAG